MHLYLMAAHWPEGRATWRPSLVAGPCCWPTIPAAAASTSASPRSGPALAERDSPSRPGTRLPAWRERSNLRGQGGCLRCACRTRRRGRSLERCSATAYIAGNPGPAPEPLCAGKPARGLRYRQGARRRRACPTPSSWVKGYASGRHTGLADRSGGGRPRRRPGSAIPARSSRLRAEPKSCTSTSSPASPSPRWSAPNLSPGATRAN